MKKYIMIISCLAISLLVSVPGFSKDKEKEPSSILTFDESGNYEYIKVYEIPGKSKEEIYNAIKNWIVENIKSQSNTNYFDDEGKSKLTTAPYFPIVYNGNAGFKLVIDVKDAKFRLAATSFIYITLDGAQKELGDYTGIYGAGKKVRIAILADIDEKFKNIISSIEKSAKSGSEADW
ncbi:MAG: DUF4468 domain-containing protein [Taibaiella sp.]|nr:DUF4468 domain-containing protein [Taibaiella sp.]